MSVQQVAKSLDYFSKRRKNCMFNVKNLIGLLCKTINCHECFIMYKHGGSPPGRGFDTETCKSLHSIDACVNCR